MLTFVFTKDQNLTAIFITDSTFSIMYLCPVKVSWKRMSFAYEENSFSEPIPVNTCTKAHVWVDTLRAPKRREMM